jgi:hypothetical protein
MLVFSMSMLCYSAICSKFDVFTYMHVEYIVSSRGDITSFHY